MNNQKYVFLRVFRFGILYAVFTCYFAVTLGNIN